MSTRATRTTSSSPPGGRRARSATGAPSGRRGRGCPGGARRSAARWSRSSTTRPIFLPIWLRYYSRFFAAEDIYVLDNDTTDGSTQAAGLRPRSRSPSDRVDHVWMAETLAGVSAPAARALRRRPRHRRRRDRRAADPTCGTLGAYIDRLDEEFVNPLGYEVLHLPDREPAARSRAPDPRPARLLVRQRRLRQADAGDRADDLGPRPAHERRRSPELRSGPAPDPPAPHGLRALPRPALGPRQARAGTTADLDAGWAGLQPRSTRGDEFERWFLTRFRVRERGDPHRPASRSRRRGRASCEPRAQARGPDRARRRPDRAFRPPRRRAEHWQRVVMNEAVEARIAALGPESAARGGDQRRPARRASRGREYVSLAWPDFDLCAPLTEERRFDLVICEQVLEHVPDPCAAVDEPARALRARRPGDRLDAVFDQGPRVPELRDARLLALHPARAPNAARSAPGSRSRASVPGATASAWSATSATGRRTGAGIRCATSPTSRSRSGRSRERPE